MQQINFRLKAEDKQILKQISKFQGISVAEYVKRTILKDMGKLRIEAAFSLLKNRKIDRKRAFFLSGLTYNEFTLELNHQGIHEHCSEVNFEQGIDTALNLDLTPFLKRKIK